MKKSLFIVFLFFYSIVSVNGQSIYRSLVSGNWNTPASWQIRTGVNTWATSTSTFPTATDTVYIQKGHTIAIIAEAACYNLHIDIAGVLNISGTFNVNVNGKIRAFTAAAAEVSSIDATYQGASSTATAATMIATTSSGLLRFVGGTRNITENLEWNSSGTSFNVEFSLNSGAIGTLISGIKFKIGTVSSGIISMGSSAFIAVSGASFTIKNGARLITARSTSTSIGASGTTPATLIKIDDGGVLEFTGTNPKIDAVTFTNNGTIVYSGTTQAFMIGGASAAPLSLTTAQLNASYDSLQISGSATKTANSPVTVNGGLIVNSGCTLAMGANQLLGGFTNITNNGLITTLETSSTPFPSGKNWSSSGAGTVQYAQGVGNQTIVSGNYFNLTLSNTGTSFNTLSGTIGIAGVFTLGTSTVANAVTGSTVNFNNPTGGQTIPATTYNNLTISNTSGNNTLTGIIKVGGAFSPSTTSTYTITGSTIEFTSLTGSQTIPAFTYNNLKLSNTSGSNTLSNTGVIYIAGAFTIGTSTTPNVVTGSTVNFNSLIGNQTIPATYFNNLILSNTSGTNIFSGNAGDTIRIAGTFTPNALAVNVTGSTVNFNNPTGGQTIPAFSYNNLVFSNTSGANTLVNGGTINVSGAFTPGSSSTPNIVTGNTFIYNKSTGGQTVAASYYNNLTIGNLSASMNTILQSSGIIYIAGTYNPGAFPALFTVDGSTVNFNGTAAQNIPATNYNNLTISNNVSATLLTGSVNILGSFVPSSVSTAATGNTINFNNPTGSQLVPRFNYYNLALNNTSGANTLVNGDTIFITGLSFTGGTSPTPNIVTNNTVKFSKLNGGQTIGANYFNNLIVANTSGTTTLTTGTIYIYGTFTPGTQPYTVPVGNTVNFANTLGGQTIPRFNFYNLTVSATAGNTTTLVADTIGVANTFTTGSGNFVVPTGNTINYNSAATTPGQTIPYLYYYNIMFANNNATTYNTLAANIKVKNSLTLAGRKGLTPGTFSVIYDPNATLYFTGTTSDTIYKDSPQWPELNGPTNVTINSLSNTLNFDWKASSSDTFRVVNVQSVGTTATITTSTTHNFNVGDSITIGGLSNSEYGAIFGGIFVVAAPTTPGTNTFTVTVNYDTTVNAPVIGGVAKTRIIRSIPGFLSLYNGGKIAINYGNFLKMTNGSTIYRNDSTAQITNNNGFLAIGNTSTDRVNITIANTMKSDNEFAYFATPGKYGKLKILPNATYYPKGSRTIVDLENYGILKLIDTSSTNFYIYGSLSGPGTIGGSDSATLKFLGTNPGYAGRINMTPGFQKLYSLSLNRNVAGFSVSLFTPVNIKQILDLSYGALLDSGNVISVSGTITGTASGSHVSYGAGKITMLGTNPFTKCLRGGAYTLGNLEINPGAGNVIYDSTTFTVANDLLLTSGNYLISPSTNYITTVLGNISGTASSSGPGKIKMTGIAKNISGVTIDSLEIASGATISAISNFNINRGLLLNGSFADGGYTVSNAGIIFGSGTHSGTGKIKMTGIGSSILGNPSLMNIEIGAPSASVTSGFSATINGALFMNGGAVNINTGNTLQFKNNTSIFRASGTLTNNGSLLFGSSATDVVNVVYNGNLRTTGELPNSYAPGKIDLTINNGFSDTLNNNNKTVRNLFLNNGSLKSLFDSTTRLPYNLTVTDTCFVLGNFNLDSSAYSYAGINNFYVAPMLNILGTFKFGNVNTKTFKANGFMTIKSSATQTANVADITNNSVNTGNAITGNVIVERYISGWRAWRLLSMPTKHNLQTIKEAWQENQSAGSTTLIGYGIQISKDSANWSTTGFDLLASGGPSVKYYSSSTNTWKGIASTINVPGVSNGKFELGKAYMTFFRGDRTVNTYIASQVTVPTILREKGELYTGDLTIPVPAGQFVAIGNPYASSIDFTLTDRTNIDLGYNLWDPKIGSLGGYQAILGNSCAPCGGSFSADASATTVHPFIESGQGFFVHNSTAAAGYIKIKEQSKKNGSYLVSRNNNQYIQLRTDLYKFNNGNWDLYDGVLQLIDDAYNIHVDGSDAMKMTGNVECLSLITNDTLLAIESRSPFSINDTVKFQLGQMKTASYRLVIEPTGINLNGFNAYLEDSYLNTSTLIDVYNANNFDFSVTTNAASYNPKRFKIVFKPMIALPVTFISVQAVKKGIDESLVSWKVENQMNISSYVIERAEDGTNFSEVGNINAQDLNVVSYQFADKNLNDGVYYYRIKAKNFTGGFCLSEIVKIEINNKETMLSVTPNLVKATQEITISLNNLPNGNINIVLYDLSGKKLFSTTINHSSVNKEYKMKLPDQLPSGQYQLCAGNEKMKYCTSIVLQ